MVFRPPADNWFDAWATQPHQNAQMYVYDRCIQKHKSKHKWIAFIDVDEFFVLHNLKHRQFQDLLPAYEQYGGELCWPGVPQSPGLAIVPCSACMLCGLAASMLTAAELGMHISLLKCLGKLQLA